MTSLDCASLGTHYILYFRPFSAFASHVKPSRWCFLSRISYQPHMYAMNVFSSNMIPCLWRLVGISDNMSGTYCFTYCQNRQADPTFKTISLSFRRQDNVFEPAVVSLVFRSCKSWFSKSRVSSCRPATPSTSAAAKTPTSPAHPNKWSVTEYCLWLVRKLSVFSSSCQITWRSHPLPDMVNKATFSITNVFCFILSKYVVTENEHDDPLFLNKLLHYPTVVGAFPVIVIVIHMISVYCLTEWCLVAGQKRQSYMLEIQRLKNTGNLDKTGPGPKGSLTLNDIRLPLKKEFVTKIGTSQGMASIGWYRYIHDLITQMYI